MEPCIATERNKKALLTQRDDQDTLLRGNKGKPSVHYVQSAVFNLRNGVKYICAFSIVFERNLEKISQKLI